MKNSSCLLVCLMLPLALCACVSRPLLTIESRLHRGSTAVIKGSDSPVVVVNTGSWQGQKTVLKVREVTSGEVILVGSAASVRESVVSGGGFNIEEQRPVTLASRFPIPDVRDGRYVAELWVDGKRIDSAEFSVTGHEPSRRRGAALNAGRSEIQGLVLMGQAAVEEWAKTDPAITNLVGLVLEVKSSRARAGRRDLGTATPTAEGWVDLRVRGSDRVENVTVHWQQEPGTGAFRVVRVTTAEGADLPL